MYNHTMMVGSWATYHCYVVIFNKGTKQLLFGQTSCLVPNQASFLACHTDVTLVNVSVWL